MSSTQVRTPKPRTINSTHLPSSGSEPCVPHREVKLNNLFLGNQRQTDIQAANTTMPTLWNQLSAVEQAGSIGDPYDRPGRHNFYWECKGRFFEIWTTEVLPVLETLKEANCEELSGRGVKLDDRTFTPYFMCANASPAAARPVIVASFGVKKISKKAKTLIENHQMFKDLRSGMEIQVARSHLRFPAGDQMPVQSVKYNRGPFESLCGTKIYITKQPATATSPEAMELEYNKVLNYALDHHPDRSKWSRSLANSVTAVESEAGDFALPAGLKRRFLPYDTPLTTEATSSGFESHPAVATVDLRKPFNPTISEHSRRFTIRHSEFYKLGRVFAILWHAYDSSMRDDVSTQPMILSARYEPQTYSTIRRMIVVAVRRGHCLCIPIVTYNGQGCRKFGLQPSEIARHTVAYMKGSNPRPYPEEIARGMTKSPICIDPADASQRLRQQSRIDFNRPYTVENNSSVMNVGMVTPEDIPRLLKYWRDAMNSDLA